MLNLDWSLVNNRVDRDIMKNFVRTVINSVIRDRLRVCQADPALWFDMVRIEIELKALPMLLTFIVSKDTTGYMRCDEIFKVLAENYSEVHRVFQELLAEIRAEAADHVLSRLKDELIDVMRNAASKN